MVIGDSRKQAFPLLTGFIVPGGRTFFKAVMSKDQRGPRR